MRFVLSDSAGPAAHHAWREIARRSLLPEDAAVPVAFGPQQDGALHVADKGLTEPSAAWLREARSVLMLVAQMKNTAQLCSELFIFEDGAARTPHDLPAVVLGLLNRWEEDLSSKRDAHGRWQLHESVLDHSCLIDRPAADMICRAIAEAARRVKNLPAARTPPLTTHLSWDIDSAGMFRHGAARGSVRRVLSERTAGEALRTALRACAFFLGIGSDPHDNLDEIGDRLGEAGVRCMFFVQAVRAHRLDDYGLRHAPQLVRAVRRLRERGHTIGLHSSYATIDRETDFLRHQRRIAMRLVGGEMTHHRSHYLRMGSRADWKRLADAGIRTDWTPGFSEREGFRLGTAHPVTPWDERAEKPLPLTVIPLTAMDVTLRYHRKFTPQEATQRIEDLKKECRIAGGEFTLLWHPHNLEPTLWRGWEDVAFEENHEWHE